MASIAKLSIRGVRSFSPEDEEQVIGFCFPLTIIVGANGCGKTTIIESLKYAVTGSLPPGNKSGQSFVHDPKSIGQTNVKAAIKLRFTARTGASMIVMRCMEVTQKKSSQSFKALDGTIRMMDPNTGERVVMSHKCTELDKTIPSLMGVSKPILEHVVFCHQEDSSWPLQEGAVLKKRFDDIFDSTRYAKALVAIKDSRKSYFSDMKDMKAELEGLNSHKHAANGFKNELEATKDNISAVDDEIQKFEANVVEEEEKAAEARAVLVQVQEFSERLTFKQGDLEKEDAVLEQVQKSLGEKDMTQTHSYEELKQMLRELDDAHHGNQASRDLQEKEAEGRSIQSTLERLRRKTNELNSVRGKLDAEQEAHTATLRTRFTLMEEIHRRHKIEIECGITQDDDDGLTQGTTTTLSTFLTASTNDYTITTEDMSAFTKALDDREKDIMRRVDEARRRHRDEDDTIQKEISDLQAKKSAVVIDRKRNETAKDEARRELQNISTQSSSAYNRVKKSDVDEAKRAAVELAKSRDEMNNDPRREEITRDIRVQEDRLKTISVKIEQDTNLRNQLRELSDEQNEIDMLEKQVAQEYEILEEKLRDASYLLQTHHESHVKITPDDPVIPLEHLLDNIRNKKLNADDDVTRCNDSVAEVMKKQSEKKALQGSYQQRMAQLTQKKNILNRPEGGVNKINSVIRAIFRYDKDTIDHDRINDNTNPSEVLTYLGEQIKDYSSIDIKPEAIKRVLKRLKKMAQANMECPCCARAFLENDEINAFQSRILELSDESVSELMVTQDGVATARDAIERYEKWRKTISENIHEHIEFTRIVAEIKETEALLAGEGQAELKEVEAELKLEEEKLADKREMSNELQGLLQTVTSLHETGTRVWEKRGQVKEKKEKLELQSFAKIDDPRNLKTVEGDLATASSEKEAAYTQINHLNNEQKTLNEKISRVTNQASAAERTAREKEEAYNRDQLSSKRKDELNNLLQKYNAEEKDLEKRFAPIRKSLMQKESDRTRMRDTNSHEANALAEEMKHFDKDYERLREINDRVDFFVKSRKNEEMQEIARKLTHNSESIRSEEERLKSMKPEIERLKKEVEDSDRQKGIINQNLDLLKHRRKVDKLEEEIKQLTREHHGMGGKEASRKAKSAQQAIADLKEKIATQRGMREGLAGQRRVLKRKLNEEEYKDVEKRHRAKMIDYETTNLVVQDLDKYYDALDKALLRFHGIKIGEINKIIRELWTLTYKGQDITSIQIVSGQESSARANRSYNYRIVMEKGNSQMDMRGRCSAGQRVLASIVIRLALAETFCLNCGVMALDEPTTNLDHENKKGLAIALAQIIASRAAQSNFQLVVITHDEDFVSMMKNELSSQTGFTMPERYYQVSREEGHDGKFYSKISAVDWDEL